MALVLKTTDGKIAFDLIAFRRVARRFGHEPGMHDKSHDCDAGSAVNQKCAEEMLVTAVETMIGFLEEKNLVTPSAESDSVL